MKSFDKYFYYTNSVQIPDEDVIFFRDTFVDIKKKKPKTLKEDFCGTFRVCCEWVKLDDSFQAVGVDFSEEALDYGKTNYFTELDSNQKKRLKILNQNVLDKTETTDIVVAQNFSYYIFKEREQLKKYFKNAYETLDKNGLFFLDCFGGSECYFPNEEEVKHKDFSYFWDQDSFDPITNEALFYIHFKRKGEKKREKVFVYDWRMWSIPEIKEILKEVGFRKSLVYWEGTTVDGEGDGVFTPQEQGESCESWIAYIVSEK